MNEFSEIRMNCSSVELAARYVLMHDQMPYRIDRLKLSIEKWESEKMKDKERFLVHLMLTIITSLNLGIERQHRTLEARLKELRKEIDNYLEELNGENIDT